MSKKKKMVREAFRSAVFSRDKHACVMCGVEDEDFDAHHITDRSLMPHGGYVKENGITLCPPCHMKAEGFHISGGARWDEGWHPDDLYEAIGSSYARAVVASERLG